MCKHLWKNVRAVNRVLTRVNKFWTFIIRKRTVFNTRTIKKEGGKNDRFIFLLDIFQIYNTIRTSLREMSKWKLVYFFVL